MTRLTHSQLRAWCGIQRATNCTQKARYLSAKWKQDFRTVEEAFSSESSCASIRSCWFCVSICSSWQDWLARSLEKRTWLGRQTPSQLARILDWPFWRSFVIESSSIWKVPYIIDYNGSTNSMYVLGCFHVGLWCLFVVRWKWKSGHFAVTFIAAKPRVKPLKQLAIPRLQLQGAVLATRLSKTILDETQLKFERTIFFLDCSCMDSWRRKKI